MRQPGYGDSRVKIEILTSLAKENEKDPVSQGEDKLHEIFAPRALRLAG